LDHKTKNLLFLLSAAPMGMAGCLGSGDDSDTLLTLTTGPFTTFSNEDETTDNSGDGDGDPSGDGDGDGDPSGDGDGDGDGDPGDGDGDPGDGDGDPGDGDGDSGDGDGDSGDGDGDATTGGYDVGELCTPYSEAIADCYGPEYLQNAYASCALYYEMSMDDPACLSAFEAFLVCISDVPCGNFSMAIGCETEVSDYQSACA
jgi:hypothetical protein